MSLENMFNPKPAEKYQDLTNGGKYEVELNQHEACVALKIHDYGVDTLTESEKQTLHILIAKLKDEIYP